MLLQIGLRKEIGILRYYYNLNIVLNIFWN